LERCDRISRSGFESGSGHPPSDEPDCRSELISLAAEQHGIQRWLNGYSAAMMVKESEMLQFSIFETLERNMAVTQTET
jgi:hypothetical protein